MGCLNWNGSLIESTYLLNKRVTSSHKQLLQSLQFTYFEMKKYNSQNIKRKIRFYSHFQSAKIPKKQLMTGFELRFYHLTIDFSTFDFNREYLNLEMIEVKMADDIASLRLLGY